MKKDILSFIAAVVNSAFLISQWGSTDAYSGVLYAFAVIPFSIIALVILISNFENIEESKEMKLFSTICSAFSVLVAIIFLVLPIIIGINYERIDNLESSPKRYQEILSYLIKFF